MATTTNWEWTSLARTYVDSFSGGAYSAKSPTTVQRFRFSDDGWNAQAGTQLSEGDQSSSLSGYNGGTTETITAPTMAGVGRFGTNTNWADNTSNWIESGGHNGKSMYTQNSLSKYDSGLVDVIFFADVLLYSDFSYDSSCWWCCAVAPNDLGALPTKFYEDEWDPGIGPNLPYYIPTGTDIRIINGAKTSTTTIASAFSPVYFSSVVLADLDSPPKDWTSNSTFSTATRTINFECISDVQSYSPRGVEWYKQTQTWRTLPV